MVLRLTIVQLMEKVQEESRCNGQFEAVEGRTQKYKLEAVFPPMPDFYSSYAHGHRSVPCLTIIQQSA